MTSLAQWIVSIDAGGTFTDAIAHANDGRTLVTKTASTPDDPSRGLTNAVAELAAQGMDLDEVKLVCHGTTVATNATLTGNLARVALITTRGFRDVMAYRQGSRPQVYSLKPERPNELVERHARFEVNERIASNGSVVTALQQADIDAVLEKIEALAPEAIAVSLLFSYLNPVHEDMLLAALAQRFPHTPVTISSQVAREFREYPRTATTVINAALRPVVGDYLERAAGSLASGGVLAPFQVMQSNGGCVPAGRAAGQAHRLILSGPAGGVSGLLRGAAEHGLPNVISLDMGGTSVDVCLVRGSQAPYTSRQEVQDHTLIAPTVDIHTIGAGGGSIAWVDRTKRLRVGPQSAKAVPGPASYGRGGTAATLTDAHVVLGTLGSGALAGDLRLDYAAAEKAVRDIGDQLGMGVIEAAEAILAIAMAHMVRAVRKVSVERGLDPREFSLFPFGGAGPLHAGLLLRHLGLSSVVVPHQPGLYSADGLLAAGLRIDDSQTLLRPFGADALPPISGWLAERRDELVRQVIEDGAAPGSVQASVTVDCRYLGQGYELSVPLDGTSVQDLELIAERFHPLHRELYGHSSEQETVEIVTVRLAVTGGFDRVAQPARVAGTMGPADAAIVGRRTVHLPGTGERSTTIYDRTKLQPGNTLAGPAIIQQMDATTVMLAGQSGRVTANGDIIITEDN
ncbi:hydantoinase/oxoprolinase family protein [Paeniglutamicibacter sp. ABSL32-1]|uniref:hydantoinase/oxoprolinase family protein n=1 Tax=Paeniglutamicibacter quisquiliarum TaxID=2849498 RepID=UPI001C2DE792|nr:hydantoinase/oxoprolinase family protein [Paeniglutamicibacter quisquiliarum]MBV1780077.1 hydantoinase/oxoprolinase family protein [Paeniglutamicibacter quisquiliarum]